MQTKWGGANEGFPGTKEVAHTSPSPHTSPPRSYSGTSFQVPLLYPLSMATNGGPGFGLRNGEGGKLEKM